MIEENQEKVNQENIINVNIENEMQQSYTDYSMSVIVARALPDVRDGFKPVHRRVLYGMHEGGYHFNKATRKCARIVGDVMGKYHPHGDSAIYNTLVRLAQPWALRYPLVSSQGNFGSIDGDNPAAMRYTEARMSALAEEMLKDIDKDTVDFSPNFDESTKEPNVLPTRLPNLLVNGAQGIAVAMATNMAPHNLGEIVDGIVAYIDNPAIDVPGLMQYIKAPDFPTGGTIVGMAGVTEAFLTGKGRVIIRSKCEIETSKNGCDTIIVSEIPYMINKSDLVKQIAGLIKDKKIEGVSEIIDASGKDKMVDIHIVLKKDVSASVVLNKLYKLSMLQSSFSINNTALVNGRPAQLNLKQLIRYFVEHRMEVVVRRTIYDLQKAQERDELVRGCLIIFDFLDEAIQIIRASANPEEARQALMDRFGLTFNQADYIVNLRLRTLTGMEQDKLKKEHEELLARIADLEDIRDNEARRYEIIKEEQLELKRKYADERRTEIEYADGEFNPEDFYPDDDMVITISHNGYIKRTPLADYRTQRRRGIGSKGSNVKEDDFIEYIHTASMHTTMLFFTQKGRCYWKKVYEIPDGSRTSVGRPIVNFLDIISGDKVTAFISVKQLNDKEFTESHNIVFCTECGTIKKSTLSEFDRPRKNGVTAIKLRNFITDMQGEPIDYDDETEITYNDDKTCTLKYADGTVVNGRFIEDKVIKVDLTSGNDEIVIASSNAKAVHFNENTVRPMGRTAAGVRGISLSGIDDKVIGMITLEQNSDQTILALCQNGIGKRTNVSEYRLTNRGVKGVVAIKATEKTGDLVALINVSDNDDLIIINKSGITMRVKVAELGVQGRVTQGVRIITLRENDSIASVCKVLADEDLNNDEQENQTFEVNGESNEETNN